MNTELPFAGLTPELMLDAVEALGLRPDGRLLALNSYENRVYQLGMDDGPPLIAKFYRPGRWTDEQIREEHDFAHELAAEEVPVIAPLLLAGQSLQHWQGYRFALFARAGGRAPELEDPDTLFRIGSFIARMHLVGQRRAYTLRPTLGLAQTQTALAQTLASAQLPPSLQHDYRAAAQGVLELAGLALAAGSPPQLLRSHGDCHAGNILWTDSGAHFVDLDDSLMAPAVQDLWLLLSGTREQQALQLSELLAGYEEFREFDYRELRLIEALRGLRQINYSAWLAARCHDPAFARAFAWFGSENYWLDEIRNLREQAMRMQPGAEEGLLP